MTWFSEWLVEWLRAPYRPKSNGLGSVRAAFAKETA